MSDRMTNDEFWNRLMEKEAGNLGDKTDLRYYLPELTGLPLQRRYAAGMIDFYLKKMRNEPRLEDISAASELLDIYDCRVCAASVMQVYGKGIIGALLVSPCGTVRKGDDPKNGERLFFGLEEPMTKEEAEESLSRTRNPSLRIPPKSKKAEQQSSFSVSEEEALKAFQNDSKAVFIDVRTAAGYAKGTVPGAKNVPMGQLLQNPFLAGSDKEAVYYLFCEGGFQSETAASCMNSAGYRKVFSFSLTESGLLEFNKNES